MLVKTKNKQKVPSILSHLFLIFEDGTSTLLKKSFKVSTRLTLFLTFSSYAFIFISK